MFNNDCKAWVRGYFACIRHQSDTDNPYSMLEDFCNYSDWIDGYYEAQTDAIIGDD